jgi:hypothetical protein
MDASQHIQRPFRLWSVSSDTRSQQPHELAREISRRYSRIVLITGWIFRVRSIRVKCLAIILDGVLKQCHQLAEGLVSWSFRGVDTDV